MKIDTVIFGLPILLSSVPKGGAFVCGGDDLYIRLDEGPLDCDATSPISNFSFFSGDGFLPILQTRYDGHTLIASLDTGKIRRVNADTLVTIKFVKVIEVI